MKIINKYIVLLSEIKTLLSATLFMLLLTQSGALFPQEQSPQPKLMWLKGTEQEKYHMIEQQFSGTYISMARVGYRYSELFFAGQDENWEFAKYQIKHIKRELKSAFIRRPHRGATAGPFLEVSLPAMDKAINAHDKQMFMQRFTELTHACNACHVAQKLPFIQIQQPRQRRSPVVYRSM